MTAMPHLAAVEWDHADRMQSADLGGGGTVWFLYDSAGNRVRKIRVNQAGTSTHERIYLGGYEVYRERVNGGVELERQTLHVVDDTGRICLVETKTIDDGDAIETPANTSRYQYGNHLGSVGMELDETGQLISYEEFHPYGTTAYRAANSAIDVSPSRYRYTGKERDEETGLGHHGARYYASWLGRWTAADPIGLGDGINRFAYTSGNPVGLRDPSGTKGASPGFEHLGFLVTTGRGSGGRGPKVMDTEGTDPGNVPEAKPPGKGGLSYGQYQAVRRRTRGVAVERAPGVVAAAPVARGALEATGDLAASTVAGVGEFVGDKLRHPEKLFNPFDAIVDTVEGGVGLFGFARQSAEDLADAAADIDIAKATGDDAGLEHARERLGASAVNTTAGAGAIVLTGRGVLGLAKPRAKASSDAGSAAKEGPAGATGPASGRPFDPSQAGGPIRQLSTEGVRVTPRGIDVVEQHLARFGPNEANQAMVARLRQIAAGELEATATDLNFYTHELREFVRYRRVGHPTGAGGDYDLWNNAHSATLEDYGLREGPGVLYHPSITP